MDFLSFLILPVQRIPRYRMLLEDLFQNIPREHPDSAHVERALVEIKEVASYVNFQMRIVKSFSDVRRIIEETGAPQVGAFLILLPWLSPLGGLNRRPSLLYSRRRATSTESFWGNESSVLLPPQ